MATNNNCRLHSQSMAQSKKWKLLRTFYMHAKTKYCKTQILYYHRTYWLTSLIWNKVHQFLIVFKRKLIHLRTYSNSLVFNNVIKWFSAMKCMPNKMKREILLMNRDFLFIFFNLKLLKLITTTLGLNMSYIFYYRVIS